MCGIVGGQLRGAVEPKWIDRSLEVLQHQNQRAVSRQLEGEIEQPSDVLGVLQLGVAGARLNDRFVPRAVVGGSLASACGGAIQSVSSGHRAYPTSAAARRSQSAGSPV